LKPVEDQANFEVQDQDASRVEDEENNVDGEEGLWEVPRDGILHSA